MSVSEVISSETQEYARILQDHGVVVIPFLNAAELKSYHQRFVEAAKTFPEYIDPRGLYEGRPFAAGAPGEDIAQEMAAKARAAQLKWEEDVRVAEETKQKKPRKPSFKPYTGQERTHVLGGFSALGNPASFHNLAVRDLRRLAYIRVLPLFTAYDGSRNRYFQELVDRMMIRKPGMAPTAESWHRDVAPDATYPADTVFGGWINLDLTETQHFSGVPGTHVRQTGNSNERKTGFAPISENQHAELGRRSKIFDIPPGHMIIFNQDLIHEVLADKAKHIKHRLFTGWALRAQRNGEPPRPLINYTEQNNNGQERNSMSIQGVMTIPSEQRPPMWSRMHHMIPAHWDKVRTWSARELHPAALGDVPRKNETFKVVPKVMRSLENSGFTKYPEYEQWERDIVRPSRSATLPLNSEGKQMHSLSMNDLGDSLPLPVQYGSPRVPSASGSIHQGRNKDESKSKKGKSSSSSSSKSKKDKTRSSSSSSSSSSSKRAPAPMSATADEETASDSDQELAQQARPSRTAAVAASAAASAAARAARPSFLDYDSDDGESERKESVSRVRKDRNNSNFAAASAKRAKTESLSQSSSQVPSLSELFGGKEEADEEGQDD